MYLCLYLYVNPCVHLNQHKLLGCMHIDIYTYVYLNIKKSHSHFLTVLNRGSGILLLKGTVVHSFVNLGVEG